MVASYVPDRGDIVWISLDPRTGHEQAGRRPFLVLSPKAYNSKTSLMVGCPITSRAKGYPFEVPVRTKVIEGVVLADQIKSLDWRQRNADFVASAARESIKQTGELIASLLSI